MSYSEVPHYPPREGRPTKDTDKALLFILVSIGTYLFDLWTDIQLAYIYYNNSHFWYFGLTLTFVLIPAGTMSAFSLLWYVRDMDKGTTPKPSIARWFIRGVFLLLQIAPLLRYFDAFLYGLRSMKAARSNDAEGQRRYHAYMISEDADSVFLRLFEAFMESAPQVTLQLYILISDPAAVDHHGISQINEQNYQYISIIASLLSLAVALLGYNRSLRFSETGRKMSLKEQSFLFAWHLCGISARVFALAVFAVTHPILMIGVCFAHWMIMLIWLIWQKAPALPKDCEEAWLYITVAFVYLFTFFNIRQEPTIYKYLTFYIITFFENSVFLLLWFLSFNETSGSEEPSWFRTVGVIGDYALFFEGVICMTVYYSILHPSVGFLTKLNSISQTMT